MKVSCHKSWYVVECVQCKECHFLSIILVNILHTWSWVSWGWEAVLLTGFSKWFWNEKIDQVFNKLFSGYLCQWFYYRIKSIFVLSIVSDWTNVFIVTWLSFAEEELTYSLALAPDWLTKHEQTHIQTKNKLTRKIKPLIGWTNIRWHAIISCQLMLFVSVNDSEVTLTM